MADDRPQSSLADIPAAGLDDLIFRRRSIRKYLSDPLPEAWVEAVLRCAHQAPSPSNCQPVRFVRIASSEYRNTLRQALVEGHARLIARHKAMAGAARLRNQINAYRRYAEFMFEAPELLAVGTSTQTQGFSTKLFAAGLMEAHHQHACDLDITVGLALKGMLLKAQSMGVGTCILTAPLVFIDHPEKLLHLERIAIKCFVCLGFAAESPDPPKRVPLDTVVQVI